MKKSCILAPVHRPKFDFARRFIESYNEHFDDNDLYIMFTTENDLGDFKGMFPKLKYQSIVYKHGKILSNNPASEKKLLGVKWLFDNTDYERVAFIDVDSMFFRHVDYDELFQQYISNKKIYGHHVKKTTGISSINGNCLRFFQPEDSEFIKKEMNDFSVYFWFNEIPIAEKNTFLEFADYINLEENASKFTNYDFDYILYAYYLMIKNHMNLVVSDYEIKDDKGSLVETQKTLPENIFKDEYNKMNPMWICRKISDDDMKNTFMMVHVDRN